MYPVIVWDEDEDGAGYVVTIQHWNLRAFDAPVALALDAPPIHFPTDIQRRVEKAKARVARVLAAAGFKRAEWPPKDPEAEPEPGNEDPSPGDGSPSVH
jgi:hypothetical protein